MELNLGLFIIITGQTLTNMTISIEKEEDVVAGGQEVALVSVKDNGTGIDADILPRLFEKFASKSFKGTGLGLFISKSIVEAHGGRI
jgi:signal transduction histidine kinase